MARSATAKRRAAQVAKDEAAIVRKALTREKIAQIRDGFVNEQTGAGTARDKNSFGHYQDEPVLDQFTLEALYEHNDLARKIVAKPVHDAMRAGWSLKRKNASPDSDREDVEAIQRRYKELHRDRLGGVPKDKRAAIGARLHGGGGLILGLKGAGNLLTPLDPEKVKSIEVVYDADRTELIADQWYPDGSPEVFRYVPKPKGGAVQMNTVRVHESRILFYPGAHTSNYKRGQNKGWDHSILQAVFQTLRSFDSMFKSTDAMFVDASQAIFKLQGLIQSLAEADGTGENDIRTRLALMDMLRSATRAVFLEAGDAEGQGEESYEVVERQTLGTLDKVIQQYYIRLACAAEMPLTVLLGMSPTGMNATGESDLILYFNSVDVYRLEVLGPNILKMVGFIHRELGLEGDPADWEMVWPELARPKPLDVMTAANMAVTAVVQLLQNQVISPEEAALNLANYAQTLGLNIDLDSREEALQEALEEIKNREMTPPTPEPVEPGPDDAGGPAGKRAPAKQSQRKTKARAAKRQT